VKTDFQKSALLGQALAKAIDILVDKVAINEFLEIVNTAHRKAADDKTRIKLEQLLGLLLPIIFDPQCVATVKTEIRQGILISLPAATHTIAEIIMAGVDGRPTDYRMPVSDDDYPVGAPLIDFMPEGGIDMNNEDSAIVAFDTHMFKEFLKGQDSKWDVTSKRKIVNNRLKYIENLAKRTDEHFYRYYFIYQEPSKEDNHSKRILEQIRANYPQLFFLSLTAAVDKMISERDLCWPLSDIYKSAKGTQGYGKTYNKAG